MKFSAVNISNSLHNGNDFFIYYVIIILYSDRLHYPQIRRGIRRNNSELNIIIDRKSSLFVGDFK